LEQNEASWRPKTGKDYEWKLSHHLLPFFKEHRLSQISIAEVDRYRAAKVKEGKLSPSSINKTIALLAQILEVATEYGMVDRNAARGRRRRLKADKPAPVWLDSTEHMRALLDAAGELDTEARVDRQLPRRAILAILCSQDCGSGSWSTCAGETWTWPRARSGSAPRRPTQGCARSTSCLS
jgi:hypothetical protein